MPHHRLRRGAALTALAVLGLGVAAPGAHAQEAEQPAAPTSLEVAVSGPATGEAGGTGEFPVTVRNTGQRPSRDLRLTTQLPEGITVRSVSAADGWTCVLGPLRCSLQRELPAGEATSALSIELHYDGLVEGPQEIAVVVSQTSNGPARFDRGVAVVDVEGEPEPAPQPQPEPQPAPEPEPEQPAPQPAPQQPVAAPAPAPAAPAPAAPRRAVAPAPAPAPAPADEPEPEPVPAEPVEPVEQPPAVLPFADTEADTDTATQGDDEDADTAAAAGRPEQLVPARGGSTYTAVLAVVFSVLLMTFMGLLARIAARRRGLIA